MANIGTDKVWEKEIEHLFRTAEKERYIYSKSDETFDAVAGLWFLGETFESTLAEIAHSYIVSSFLLKALALIYQKMRADYGLPDFSAYDLTNQDALDEFQEAVKAIQRDESFVNWFRESLLPACNKLLKRYAHNKEDISRLGNLADSIWRIAERNSPGVDGETWAYDGIFQLSDELNGIDRIDQKTVEEMANAESVE